MPNRSVRTAGTSKYLPSRICGDRGIVRWSQNRGYEYLIALHHVYLPRFWRFLSCNSEQGGMSSIVRHGTSVYVRRDGRGRLVLATDLPNYPGKASRVG